MSEAPTHPRLLAEQMVYSDVRQWMLTMADRLSTVRLAQSPQLLVPQVDVPEHPALGIRSQELHVPMHTVLDAADRCHIRLWFDSNQECGPQQLGQLLHAAQWLRHPIVFTCTGNMRGIAHGITAHQSDGHTLMTLLRGTFAGMHPVMNATSDLEERVPGHTLPQLRYRSLVPPRPCWGVFVPDSMHWGPVYAALAAIPPAARGLYQVVCVPLPAGWGRLIRLMARAESITAQQSSGHRDWLFSKDAHKEAEHKSETTIYAMVVRAGILGAAAAHADQLMASLVVGMACVQCSGAPVTMVTEGDLLAAGVTAAQLAESFISGATFHHGLVVSALELGRVIPLPTAAVLQHGSYPFDRVPALIARTQPNTGVLLAHEHVVGEERPILWPHHERSKHMLVTGTSGSGKSLFSAGLAARIVNHHAHEGIAIIDPHDTLIESMARCIADDRLPDIIYHDPLDDEFVLALPLFDCADAGQIDTATSNIAHQICALFSRAEMGFNIERGIRNVVRTILLVREFSLVDALVLLSETRKGDALREQVCAEVDDELLVEYWSTDFRSLDRASLGRIRGRLLHLLQSQRLRRMLANKVAKITYTDIIDRGLIFLARTNPAGAGPDTTEMLSSLHSTGLQTGAGARAGAEGQRGVFSILRDEFNNYENPRTVPHALRTLRKYDVSQILITQNIASLPGELQTAIGNIHTHVVLQQGWDDAQRYFKLFHGKVPTEDFMAQHVGEGFVKQGQQMSTIHCSLPEFLRDARIMEALRQQTRERYCVPIAEFTERMVEEHHVSLDELKGLDLI